MLGSALEKAWTDMNNYSIIIELDPNCGSKEFPGRHLGFRNLKSNGEIFRNPVCFASCGRAAFQKAWIRFRDCHEGSSSNVIAMLLQHFDHPSNQWSGPGAVLVERLENLSANSKGRWKRSDLHMESTWSGYTWSRYKADTLEDQKRFLGEPFSCYS